MYQIDNERAKDYQVPESTIEVAPNAYKNTTIESLITQTFTTSFFSKRAFTSINHYSKRSFTCQVV